MIVLFCFTFAVVSVELSALVTCYIIYASSFVHSTSDSVEVFWTHPINKR